VTETSRGFPRGECSIAPLTFDGFGAVTGIAPAQLLFGNVIDLDEGIFLPRTERPQSASLTDASAAMIKTQDELCRRAAELRRQADNDRLASHDKVITIFETGTYVLIQNVDQPQMRFHTKWSGPFQVLEHQNSEHKLLDLITKLVHSTRIKEFNFNPMEVDPLDIAQRDYLEYFVEEILEHRGNPKKVSTLQFLVKWLNYTEDYNTWEPLANLRLVGPLHKYLRANQMEKLIPSTTKLATRI
jgi:Chromo (CHRromatin Organisation MOdifier) domain